MLALNTAEAQPQVEVKTIAAGTKYATPMYIIRSGQPGPTFLFTGGVHGNETAGYVAARRIAKEYRVTKGTLIVIPDVNVPAIKAKRRYVSEGDLNRQFPTSKGQQAKSALARIMLDAIRPYNVQWHVDMHEGFDYYKNPKTSSVGQTLIYYPTGNNGALANKLAGELNSGIKESIRKFSVLKYPVGGSFARGTAVTLGARSFIFETSQKQTLDVRVNFQLYMVNFFLRELGMQVVKADAPAPAAPVESPVEPATPDADIPTAPEVDTPDETDNPAAPSEDKVAEPVTPPENVVAEPVTPPANNQKPATNLSQLISNPFTAVEKISGLVRK
ncbi:MAG: succinylglutamate desuccinylase/aspartoacylase family protein [Clostridia bacterium]|nr:succinylglutamate desuccinylase/aspartoacylase family protein [Clostridia bacterium]